MKLLHQPILVSLVIVLLTLSPIFAEDSDCVKKCRDYYPPQTAKAGNAIESCERGCRLFLLIDGVAKPKDQPDDDTLKTCKHSCEDSFENVKDKSEALSACQSGCGFQKPVKSGIDKTVAAKEKNTLTVPFLSIELPDMFDNMEEMKFPIWAQDMRKSMNEMHNRMMGWMKTNFNNDKDNFFTKEINDMMSKPNPLDQFLDSRNFEILDSNSLKKNDESNLGGNRVFEIEIIGPYQLDSAQINGFDFKEELESPKLPDEGLKTRQDAETIYLDHICQRDSREMSWSDLVSCIHHRMRTPRWLTVATICLSIIFIIWLCLVIPSNAPKQRVNNNQDVFLVGNAKEKEALSFVSIRMANSSLSNDLPPSYDEAANLQVKLEPVHQPLSQEETKSTKI